MSAGEHAFTRIVEAHSFIREHRLDNFSSLCNNGKRKWVPFDEVNESEMIMIQFRFYANGDSEENEDYVSIILYPIRMRYLHKDISLIEFNCTVSVIDVSGNKRFLQSLAYVHDPNTHNPCENSKHKFSFERFVMRKTLMNEPDELIPGDCLTISTEFRYTTRSSSHLAFEGTLVEDGGKCYLNLDSTLGEKLRKVSKFFQCASNFPMIERKTRRVRIPSEERMIFFYIYLILFGTKELNVRSISTVHELYVVADKYDIQLVIETCREIFKSFLLRIDDPTILEHTEKGIPSILKLAETYEDGRLKDIIETYLESKKIFEANDYALVEHLKENLVTDWNCKCGKFFDWHSTFEERNLFPIFELTRIKGEMKYKCIMLNWTLYRKIRPPYLRERVEKIWKSDPHD